jgi:hypothetical protein
MAPDPGVTMAPDPGVTMAPDPGSGSTTLMKRRIFGFLKYFIPHYFIYRPSDSNMLEVIRILNPGMLRWSNHSARSHYPNITTEELNFARSKVRLLVPLFMTQSQVKT